MKIVEDREHFVSPIIHLSSSVFPRRVTLTPERRQPSTGRPPVAQRRDDPSAQRIILPRLPRLLITLLILLVGMSVSSIAATVTLGWNPSPDPTVRGYYLLYGTESGTYGSRVDSGASTTATALGLIPGETYYFAVTAYNDLGMESLPSGEIVFTLPEPVAPPQTGELRLAAGSQPGQPARLKVRVPPTRQFELYASSDLESWTRLARSVSLTTNWTELVDPASARMPQRFYRLAVPDAPPVPGTLRLQNGPFPVGAKRLTPDVRPGERYEIQVSSDLVTWTTIFDGRCSAFVPMDLIDSSGGANAVRSYRLRMPDEGFALRPLDVREADAGPRIRVSTFRGQLFRVEASQDLKTWRTIHEGVSLSDEPIDLVDSRVGLFERRFYRVRFN